MDDSNVRKIAKGFCFLGGVLLLAFGASFLWVSHVSSSYKVTMGTVNEVSVGTGRRGYVPIVSYTFSAEGKVHTSSTVSQIQENFDKQTAEQIAGQFVKGQLTTVHYDPSDPSWSFLLPNSRFIFVWLGVIGAFFWRSAFCFGGITRFSFS